MKSQDGLRALFERVTASTSTEVQQELMEYLHLLVHDLNSPVAVFGLEIYSARGAVAALAKAAAAGDTASVERQRADLESILENLDLAQGKITAIINAIDQVRYEQA